MLPSLVPVLVVYRIGRCQRGVEMNISSRFYASLTVQEPGELCAVMVISHSLVNVEVRLDHYM